MTLYFYYNKSYKKYHYFYQQYKNYFATINTASFN